MSYASKTLILITVCICASIGLQAQLSTTDNRLFVLPPTAATAAPSPDPASDAPIPLVPVQPTILSFDQLPGSEWFVNDCNGKGSGKVSHGILTINSPSDCYEYILFDPLGDWNKYVSNRRGWIVEANLKIDPSTDSSCGFARYNQIIWANDRTNLIIVGFGTNEICIAYPEEVHFAMNTTDSFHIYRVESKGTHVRIYVDGQLAIDHFFSYLGSGTQALTFGDGSVFGTSLARWDYFSYNVFPVNLAP